MAVGIAVDADVERVPAIRIAHLIRRVDTQWVHGSIAQIYTDAIRDGVQTIGGHKLKSDGGKTAGVGNVDLVFAEHNVQSEVDEDLVSHKAFCQGHSFLLRLCQEREPRQ